MIASLHEKVSKSAWPSKYMAVLKNNMENADAPGGASFVREGIQPTSSIQVTSRSRHCRIRMLLSRLK